MQKKWKVILLIILAIGVAASITTKKDPHRQLKTEKRAKVDFAADQKPTFILSSSVSNEILQKSATVYNTLRKKIDIPIVVAQSPSGKTLTLAPTSALQPGQYTLVVDNSDTKIEQDFTWGVLAINTDKSVYLPGQVAHFSLAVLNETGAMVCDATLDLEITEPDGRIIHLTTKDNQIKVNPECMLKTYTEKPDYEASYQVNQKGKYAMKLTALTHNGTYTISDAFEVDPTVPFEVTRETATRIFPQSLYPVRITIKAQQAFQGTIIERVPKTFAISPLKDNLKYSSIKDDGEYQTIHYWLSLKKDESQTIGYIYDAPNKSPEFYLLGPLSFIDQSSNTVFSEKRHWQIATDPIQVEGTTTGNTTSGTSFTLSSWTIQPGELILLAVANRDETITDTASSTSLGSFVEVADVDNVQGQGGITLLRDMATSTATEQITVSVSGNSLPVSAVAMRISGVDTTGTNGSGAIDGSAATDVGPGTDNANVKINVTTNVANAIALAAAWHRGQTLTNPPAGGENTISLNNTVGTSGDITQVSTWYESVASPTTVTLGADGDLSASGDWAIIGVSIKPATADSGYFLLMD